MAPLLGSIADDFTGATDLAGVLVKHGMRTVQMIGVPRLPPPASSDAIVVALKTRTVPPRDAVEASLRALRWLRNAGCRQFFSSTAPLSIPMIGATSDPSPRR